MSSSTGAEPRSSSVQVLSRAVQVLRTIRQTAGGLTQAELSERLGLPKTTIHRLLSALESEELVVSAGGARARYRIGPEAMRLAEAAERDVVGKIHPRLVDLSRQTGETIDLSVLQSGQVIFIDQVEGSHRLRAASAVGEAFALHACAPGKALLASLSPSRVEELLPARLEGYTDNTITDHQDLRDELDRIRAQGFAVDNEEQSVGISAVGVAAHVDGVLVAISVPVPTQRFEGQQSEFARVLTALVARLAKETSEAG